MTDILRKEDSEVVMIEIMTWQGMDINLFQEWNYFILMESYICHMYT